MPLYPSIVLQAKKRAPTPSPFTVFSLEFTFESLKELGVHHMLKLGVFFFGPRVTLLPPAKLLLVPIVT
jgi:hypothetical protein